MIKHLKSILCICNFSLWCASSSDLTQLPAEHSPIISCPALSDAEFNHLHEKAREALSTKAYSVATEIFEKLIAQSKPKSRFAWKTHNLLGGIYFNTKNYAQAEKHFIAFTNLCLEKPDTLRIISPMLAETFTYLGHAQKELKKYSEAIFSYESALKLDPKLNYDPILQGSMALCYLEDGNMEKVKQMLIVRP